METVGNNDTIVANFVLKTDSAQLQSVQITASNKPELVKESPVLEDFEIRYGKIWLLNDYSNGNRLEVYDSNMKYLAAMKLKGRADSLQKTPHNILYITLRDSVRIFGYYTELNSVKSLAMARRAFLPNLTGLVAYEFPFYYYSKCGYLNSSIYYYYYNKTDNTEKGLYSYQNSALLRGNKATLNNTDNQVLDDFTFWGNIAGSDDGIYQAPEHFNIDMSTDSIWEGGWGSGEFEPSTIAGQEINYITCLLKVIEDSIYIFNFDNDSIYVFTPANKFYRYMPLRFDVHGLKYKQKDILVNDEGTACYFKFEERGAVYLRQIDLNTGKAASTEKLGEQFPNKIRILGDYAYYTCTQEGEYKNYTLHLYRQKL
jgi:hypothetical protein